MKKGRKVEVKEEPEEEIKYIRRTLYGDVGEIQNSLGNYYLVKFKIKGLLSVPKNLRDDNFTVITKKEFDSADEIEILRKIVNEMYVHNQPENINIYKNTVTSGQDKCDIVQQEKKSKNRTEHKKNVSTGFRGILNTKSIDGLKDYAKKLEIDTNKYNHLSGGLLKMSLVNVLLGKVDKMVLTNQKTTEEIETILGRIK